MSEDLNKTLMVLINKILGVKSIKNNRPISLCTTFYEVVTKILVNRIRPF